MLTLTHVADEVLDLITGYIDASDLCKLYQTSPILLKKLVKTVTKFWHSSSIRCVSFLSSFPSIREFCLEIPSLYRSNWEAPFELSSRLPNVKKLHLKFLGCESVFYKPERDKSADIPFIDLNTSYTYLTDLYLSNLGSHAQELLNQIPPTLLKLGLTLSNPDPEKAIYLRSLPPCLVSYIGNVEYKPAGAEKSYEFPSTLEIWAGPTSVALLLALPPSCQEIRGVDSSFRISEHFPLPNALERITVQLEVANFVFPRMLRILCISTALPSLDFGDIPSLLPILEDLRIWASNAKTTTFLARSFPKSLTAFNVACKCKLPREAWVNSSLIHISCEEQLNSALVTWLPKNLQSLNLRLVPPSSLDLLVSFPHITRLCLNSQSGPAFKLPPTLTALQFGTLMVPTDQTDFWPRYLVELVVLNSLVVVPSLELEDKPRVSNDTVQHSSTTSSFVLDLPKFVTTVNISTYTDWKPCPLLMFSKIPEWRELQNFAVGSVSSPSTIALLPLLSQLSGIHTLNIQLGPSEVLTREHLKLLKPPLTTLLLRSSTPTTILSEDISLIPRTTRTVQLPNSPGAIGYHQYLPRNVGFVSIPTFTPPNSSRSKRSKWTR